MLLVPHLIFFVVVGVRLGALQRLFGKIPQCRFTDQV